MNADVPQNTRPPVLLGREDGPHLRSRGPSSDAFDPWDRGGPSLTTDEVKATRALRTVLACRSQTDSRAISTNIPHLPARVVVTYPDTHGNGSGALRVRAGRS